MTNPLLILKLLGLIASGTFGIIGTMHEFRDSQTKRLTQWGKVAVIGTVISALVAISCTALGEPFEGDVSP